MHPSLNMQKMVISSVHHGLVAYFQSVHHHGTEYQEVLKNRQGCLPPWLFPFLSTTFWEKIQVLKTWMSGLKNSFLNHYLFHTFFMEILPPISLNVTSFSYSIITPFFPHTASDCITIFAPVCHFALFAVFNVVSIITIFYLLPKLRVTRNLIVPWSI